MHCWGALQQDTWSAAVQVKPISGLEQETVGVLDRCVTEGVKDKLLLKTNMCIQTDTVNEMLKE